MIERASQDNAIKRALKLEATKVSTVLHQMIPTNFVIVRCLKTGDFFIKKLYGFNLSYKCFLLLLHDIRCWPFHGCWSMLCWCWKEMFVCALVDSNILVPAKRKYVSQNDFCARDGQNSNKKQNSRCTDVEIDTKNTNAAVQHGLLLFQQVD